MRIDDNTDTHLAKQQFGFRKNRGTVDAIFIEHGKGKRAQDPVAFYFCGLQGCICYYLEKDIVEDVDCRGEIWRSPGLKFLTTVARMVT